jgi:hypothetical protein
MEMISRFWGRGKRVCEKKEKMFVRIAYVIKPELENKFYAAMLFCTFYKKVALT